VQPIDSLPPSVKLLKSCHVVLGIRIHVEILAGGDLGAKSNQIVLHPDPLLDCRGRHYEKPQICLQSYVFDILVAQMRALLGVIDDLL
jgi:hypothetical protein